MNTEKLETLPEGWGVVFRKCSKCGEQVEIKAKEGDAILMAPADAKFVCPPCSWEPLGWGAD